MSLGAATLFPPNITYRAFKDENFVVRCVDGEVEEYMKLGVRRTSPVDDSTRRKRSVRETCSLVRRCPGALCNDRVMKKLEYESE